MIQYQYPWNNINQYSKLQQLYCFMQTAVQTQFLATSFSSFVSDNTYFSQADLKWQLSNILSTLIEQSKQIQILHKKEISHLSNEIQERNKEITLLKTQLMSKSRNRDNHISRQILYRIQKQQQTIRNRSKSYQDSIKLQESKVYQQFQQFPVNIVDPTQTTVSDKPHKQIIPIYRAKQQQKQKQLNKQIQQRYVSRQELISLNKLSLEIIEHLKQKIETVAEILPISHINKIAHKTQKTIKQKLFSEDLMTQSQQSSVIYTKKQLFKLQHPVIEIDLNKKYKENNKNHTNSNTTPNKQYTTQSRKQSSYEQKQKTQSGRNYKNYHNSDANIKQFLQFTQKNKLKLNIEPKIIKLNKIKFKRTQQPTYSRRISMPIRQMKKTHFIPKNMKNNRYSQHTKSVECIQSDKQIYKLMKSQLEDSYIFDEKKTKNNQNDSRLIEIDPTFLVNEIQSSKYLNFPMKTPTQQRKPQQTRYSLNPRLIPVKQISMKKSSFGHQFHEQKQYAINLMNK